MVAKRDGHTVVVGWSWQRLVRAVIRIHRLTVSTLRFPFVVRVVLVLVLASTSVVRRACPNVTNRYGDEVEFHLVAFDDVTRSVRVPLNAYDVLGQLKEQTEKHKVKGQACVRACVRSRCCWLVFGY